MTNDSNSQNQTQQDVQEKKKNLILILSSVVVLILVAAASFFILKKLNSSNSGSGLSQEQFEGVADISAQLQIECQNSAIAVAKSASLADAETEFRKHFENCKNVFFTLEFETPYRREGVYADLVVDLAEMHFKQDKAKAVQLLKDIKALGEWDFSLGPVSCSSSGVLEAYIESFSLERSPVCYSKEDLKEKLLPALQTKNFSVLNQLTKAGEVVWLGIPDSDVGCPERLSSALQTIKSLTQGSVQVEEGVVEHTDRPQSMLNIKLSDKEMINLVFNVDKECAELTTILVPNSEVVE